MRLKTNGSVTEILYRSVNKAPSYSACDALSDALNTQVYKAVELPADKFVNDAVNTALYWFQAVRHIPDHPNLDKFLKGSQ